ncbi:tol-pal system protein YbgF [Desulfobotulus alkaliphilus]|uniref:Tol-pal system protein YbgF n=1 Tax=Desulfobotulus alkaliphilus TaxID=622671 RepID=A0A562RRQ1_9BACT|nr:tol-pal system protein YbgF [Desulfobotulus alkaliphilus]TWI71781.1 tol-pal system protein YbgF [Desulfobotulus alkaliphilus]
MIKAKGCSVWLFVSAVFFLSGCATRHEVIDMDSRLRVMEEQRETRLRAESEVVARMGELEGRMEAQEQDLRSSFARMRSEMDHLRLAIQELQGSLEESTFRTRGVTEKRNLLAEELAFLKDSLMTLSGRMQHMADYVGFESSGEELERKKVVNEEKKVDIPDLSPDLDALYKEAKQAFDNGLFEKARDGFHEILVHFPDSNLADNAQFWIGDIYYREKWYEKAILEYQKVIDNYPKGNKVASALLKQGFAFEKLGQKANARLILEELLRKYPGSSESLIAQRKLRQL